MPHAGPSQLPYGSIPDYHLGGDDPHALADIHAPLGALYKTGNPLDIPAAEALFTPETTNVLDTNGYQRSNRPVYLDSEFGAGLEQVAMLIKAEVGLVVAYLDLGGWDTHIAQGGDHRTMAVLLGELAQGLSAFYGDLAEKADRFLVVVMSEFGRRVK